MPENKNINNNGIECLNIENVSKTSKDKIISCIYRPARGDAHKFLDEMKGHVNKNKFQEKPLFLDGDLNIPWTILKTHISNRQILKRPSLKEI